MPNAIHTRPKHFVFVLMPLADEFEDVYKLGIKAACEAAGTYCERVDEQIYTESILQRIYNQIAHADLIVSDMTGRNPNVFYETGYAHALGKEVILLTQSVDDIPFDLKHYFHIVYGGRISKLRNDLARRVRWSVENPSTDSRALPVEPEFYFEGSKVADGASIRASTYEKVAGTSILRLSFDVHNPTDQVWDAATTEIGLVVPKLLRRSINCPSVILPDDQCMHTLPRIEHLQARMWKPLIVEIEVADVRDLERRAFDCKLRVFDEFRPQEVAFQLKFEKENKEQHQQTRHR